MKTAQPVVALLPWGNVLEDFLSVAGISFETFCNDFTGSWMFGYVDALRDAGVRTVLIFTSGEIAAPMRLTHRPTGALLCLLPAPKLYRFARRKMANPYGRTVQQMFGWPGGKRKLLLPILAPVKETALYFTTPLRLIAHDLRREGCRAILCQEYEYPRFDLCVLLGGFMRLPVFATFQGGDYQRSRIEKYLRPRALRRCAGLIIATRREALRVRNRYGIPPAKIAQILNPIDLRAWKPMDRSEARAALAIPAAAKVVVWHGRISIWQKGLDILLDAWAQLCQRFQGSDMRLLIIGGGSDTVALQQRISEMRLTGVICSGQFVNDRAMVRRCLAAGNVYAFPSRHEGFPVSVIEAMTCGLPVVAADAEGICDILGNGELAAGLIVPKENPGALADSIDHVLRDGCWSEELSRRARRRAEDFSHRIVGQQLRRFLLTGAASDATLADSNRGNSDR